MPKKPTVSAADFLPEKLSLPALALASKDCRGCHLYKEGAKQTVFGEGNSKASLIIVGEIPGEKEDEKGRPFVGPAGTLLRNSIEQAGIDDEDIYFTNVVKHFKFVYLNNRKLHRSPVGSEIRACLPWLASEIQVIEPKAILCLGATAAKSLAGKDFLIRTQRGKWFKHQETIKLMATFHPSAILRAIDHESRDQMRKFLLMDLKKVASYIYR